MQAVVEKRKIEIEAASGDPTQAAQLMIVDRVPQLAHMPTDAIKNIGIDEEWRAICPNG